MVYGCEEPGDVSPTWNCGQMAASEPSLEHTACASGTQIIYGWAMDAKSLSLPEGVGFRRYLQALRKARNTPSRGFGALSLYFMA